MFIEMKVSGLTMDPITNTPIVILKDLDEKKAIPIWIGTWRSKSRTRGSCVRHTIANGSSAKPARQRI